MSSAEMLVAWAVKCFCSTASWVLYRVTVYSEMATVSKDWKDCCNGEGTALYFKIDQYGAEQDIQYLWQQRAVEGKLELGQRLGTLDLKKQLPR